MSGVQDSTVATRVPLDLRQDLDQVVERKRAAGETRLDGQPIDLSTLMRAVLRQFADVELGRVELERKVDHATRTGLFARTGPAVRDGDPATSKAAAVDVAPRVGSQRRRALAHIVAAGADGLTADEVVAAIELTLCRRVAVNSIARRVTDLLQAGAIRERRRGEVGEELYPDLPVTRPTRNGAQATVYVATAKGREWLNTNRSETTDA